ncbi:MAG: CHAD domain-containing protein [Thaumarchaeota archaeon]|nr:CHAD domain-containing protein [Nitrososphaerota archaeon]
MKRPNSSSLRLGKTFNENVTTLCVSLREFVKSADPASTQSLRKAIRRVRVSYLLMPKSLRDERRFKRYVNSLRRLSKATGKVRDLDTITAWAAEAKALGHSGERLARGSHRPCKAEGLERP